MPSPPPPIPRLTGDAHQITVPQNSASTIGAAKGVGRRPGIRAKVVTMYCPDGTDPGIPANTDTVYVGPNKATAFPIAPGAVLTLEGVDPYLIGCVSKTAGQLLFVVYGGEFDRP